MMRTGSNPDSHNRGEDGSLIGHVVRIGCDVMCSARQGVAPENHWRGKALGGSKVFLFCDSGNGEKMQSSKARMKPR